MAKHWSPLQFPMKNSAHRYVLKQQNKKFKGSSASSKRKIAGKEGKKKGGSCIFKALNKVERRNQSKIAQKAKNERFSDMKRIFQGSIFERTESVFES